MKMVRVKTKSLTGRQLDAAVAIAQGYELLPFLKGTTLMEVIKKNGQTAMVFSPSRFWEQGGPIIHDIKISIDSRDADKGIWRAHIWMLGKAMSHSIEGKSELEAAMRCYVLLKLGMEVEVPEEVKA